MRFCMATTFYPPHNFGGDGLFVQQLARDLVGEGHEVHVVHCADAYAMKARAEPAPAKEDDGVQVHTLRSRAGSLSPLLTQATGRPGLKRAALRRVLAKGFDVINFHNISLIGGPSILRMGQGIKLMTLHEHWWVCPTHILWKYTGELCTKPSCLACCIAHRTPPQAWRLAGRWRARCLEALDAILASSRFTAERHQAWLTQHGVRTPIEICPLYAPRMPGASLAAHELPKRFFLFVGRVIHQKGIDLLMEAFAQRPDHALVVVGDRSKHPAALVCDLPNIHWMGQVPRAQLGGFYEAADALVFPSLCAETFGLTPVEAYRHGTPVIGKPSGGAADVLEGPAAIRFDSITQLLEALDHVRQDDDARAAMGRAARARFEAEYTWPAYRDRYFSAIERARASHEQLA